jgi:hypothetical protein
MTKYHNTRKAARLLDLSESQMRKMRHYRTGPVWAKFGSAVRYSEDALDAWAAECSQTSTCDESEAA